MRRMKRAILFSIVFSVSSLSRATAQAPRAADIAFDSVPNFLKLPPDMNFGEVAGIAVNSKGHIFVYHRGRLTQLFEFDRDGKFLREIGKDLYGFEQAHV